MKQVQNLLHHPEYRPDIDGLRAVAVLSVVGYHTFPELVPGGFVGVDVFFVISGFLISTILFRSMEQENFSYLEFYSRRIKRIFPALMVVLLSCIAIGWYLLFPNEYSQLGKHISAGAGFVSNFAIWSEVGYFDQAAKTKPLLHLWSLGIEEQFYILWPLLLGLTWHRKISFLSVTIFIAIISFSINIYAVHRYPAANFFFPISRFWELLAGGVLAYFVLRKPRHPSSNNLYLTLLSLTGLGLILFSVLIPGNMHLSYPGWWSLLPVGGTLFLIVASKNVWTNRKVLSNRFMVWMGLISYPLYLWHWPLLSFNYIVENGEPSVRNKLILVLASIFLAWATYELIEKRFKKAYTSNSIIILSSLMSLLFIVGLFMWNGIPEPRQNSRAIEFIESAADDWSYPAGLTPETVGDTTFYSIGKSQKKTLFFGDSHMEQYAPRIVEVVSNNPAVNTAVFATRGGCRPVPTLTRHQGDRCQATLDAAMNYLMRTDVTTVVIGAAWNSFLLEKFRKPAFSETFTAFTTNHSDKTVSVEKRKLQSFLRKLAESKNVYLLLDNPGGKDFSPHSLLQGTRFNPLNNNSNSRLRKYALFPPDQDSLRDELRLIAARSGATVLDPAIHLCANNSCKVLAENGLPIYKDGWHLRPFFVEQHADFIDITLE